MELNYHDPNGLTSTAIVFNKNKFYLGRAIKIDGTDEDGETIQGVFLIKTIRLQEMIVIGSDGE